MWLRSVLFCLLYSLFNAAAVANEVTPIVAQVSSHRDPEEARRVVFKLAKQYPIFFRSRHVHILPEEVQGDGVWFRTFIGSHKSEVDAETYCSILRKRNLTCIVRVVPLEILRPTIVRLDGGIDLPKVDIQQYYAVAANLARGLAGLVYQRNYFKLSKLVHPSKGLRVSPYATVDLKRDQVIFPKQFLDKKYRHKYLVWGRGYDGNNIVGSIDQYFRYYQGAPDFTKAPLVGVMDIHPDPGSHINNIPIVYPGSFYFDLYFPPSKAGESDWVSRRLVFEKFKGRWFLLGMIDARHWP